MRKVGDIELEAVGSNLRTKRTQSEGGWWVAEIHLGSVVGAELLSERMAAAFNATRHMTLEQIRGGVVAVPAQGAA